MFNAGGGSPILDEDQEDQEDQWKKSPMDSGKLPRGQIEWRSLGIFDSEEAMNLVRGREKVSKRKTDQLRQGVKVTYRCNRWKRTRCPFQMYALYKPNGQIALYECAQHEHQNRTINNKNDHQGLRSSNSTEPWQSYVEDPEPPPTGAHLLNCLLLKTANDNEEKTTDIFTNTLKDESLYDNNDRMVTQSNGVPPLYHLQEGHSIAQLLQVASDLDLAFTFNARRSGEYCFESNRGGGMVVFADLGDQVRVSERCGAEELNIEMWHKADWAQFCWAVLGKCRNFLK